jgi:hypothetical protein
MDTLFIIARIIAAFYGATSLIGVLWAFPSLGTISVATGVVTGVGALILALSRRESWKDKEYLSLSVVIAVTVIIADLIHIAIRVQEKISSLSSIARSEALFLSAVIVLLYELWVHKRTTKIPKKTS